MKKTLLLLLTLVCTSARGQQHELILNLLSQMTIEEKVDLLHATSPGVPRLGVSKYYMGNEALPVACPSPSTIPWTSCPISTTMM